MNITFGIAAIASGVAFIVKLESLPLVVLSLILGVLVGEVVQLDDKVKALLEATEGFSTTILAAMLSRTINLIILPHLTSPLHPAPR